MLSEALRKKKIKEKFWNLQTKGFQKQLKSDFMKFKHKKKILPQGKGYGEQGGCIVKQSSP